MIQLKSEINKAEFKRIMKQKANEIYEYAWQPALNIEAFMYAVELTLKELQIKKGNNNER